MAFCGSWGTQVQDGVKKFWFPAILCVVGIINAAGGKLKPLPVIGKFTIIK